MNYDVTLSRIANCYYNLGLERARLRDLSGAAELLKKSLQFDKFQKDARNLLGLVFFECGETADALVQWVISLNMFPQDNLADHFLDEIQRKPSILRICSDNVKRFNQALDYAQHGNEDLAAMELNRVISDRPNYIKAHILLALLYMERENWIKAGKSLYKVLRIDRNNPQALVLMDEVKQNTGRKEVEQSRLRNAFSHRQITEDDVIMPQEVKQVSPWAVVLYILIGFVISLLFFYLLLIPSNNKALNSRNNREIAAYAERLDLLNREIRTLRGENDTIKSQYNEASEKIASYESENAVFMEQYGILNQIQASYESGDIENAALQYMSLDQSLITDENLKHTLAQIKSYMDTVLWRQLSDQGTALWNAGRIDEAAPLYELSVQLHADAENMFLLGRLYQSQGDADKASELFDRVVGEFPDSTYAGKAREARGY